MKASRILVLTVGLLLTTQQVFAKKKCPDTAIKTALSNLILTTEIKIKNGPDEEILPTSRYLRGTTEYKSALEDLNKDTNVLSDLYVVDKEYGVIFAEDISNCKLGVMILAGGDGYFDEVTSVTSDSVTAVDPDNADIISITNVK